jgi:hypothetical protein
MENTKKSTAPQGGYGYEEHVAKESAFVFGLNAGTVKLTKFAHTMTGGKDNAELEAIDIAFDINGTEKGYRKFPISKAYAKDDAGNQIEVTDPAHPNFIQAQKELSATLVHIVGVFADKAAIKDALTRQITSFKQYCEILASLLPEGFETESLDAFAQYQWQIKGDNKVTYLAFPKNMKHGGWLGKAIAPKDAWEKQHRQGVATGDVALRYVDVDGEIHPFQRNGWFMESNFASQQKEAQSSGGQAMQGANSGGGDW